MRHKATAYTFLDCFFTLSRQRGVAARRGADRLNFEQMVEVQRQEISERLEPHDAVGGAPQDCYGQERHHTCGIPHLCCPFTAHRTYPDIQAIGYSARAGRENSETYPIVYLEPANSRNSATRWNRRARSAAAARPEQARDFVARDVGAESP
jgi:hypothetical protein